MSSRDRRTPTPQLALRVAAFGIIAFGVFAILFLRLWFLQILQGDQYLTQAAQNGARVVRIAAPRGNIVDRNKQPLVENEAATVVTLQADAIPALDQDRIKNWGQKQGEYDVAVTRLSDRLVDAQQQREQERRAQLSDRQKDRRAAAERRETVQQAKARQKAADQRYRRRRNAADHEARARLAAKRPRPLTLKRDASPELTAKLRHISGVLSVSPQTLYQRVVNSMVKLPWAGVALKSKHVTPAMGNYLRERQADYPGITVTKEYLRHYPQDELAAQILGNIGEISADQLKEAKYRDLHAGQKIGQSGLEYEYDSYLRGRDGRQEVEVNAQGRPTGKAKEIKPKQGDRLRLTLDSGLEATAQYAIQREIGRSIDSKTNDRAGGAVVAIDPRNGQVLAMESYPALDLNVAYGAISRKHFDSLTSKRNGTPLLNRAIQGQYPIGSTFKIVTAVAGLTSGIITPDEEVAGGAYAEFGSNHQRFYNAGKEDLGSADLVRALQISSDVYFYKIGAELFQYPDKPLQTWAGLFGYGHKTGIDLPGEAKGEVPSSAWRAQRNQDELDCRKRKKVKSCGLVYDVHGKFLLGDNVNLAVGQGDFLATPLQLAVAYSGLYDPPGQTSDKLRFPTPQLALQVESPQGVPLHRFDPQPRRSVDIDPGWKKKIEDGLWKVTSTPEGTAGGVFAGWDQAMHPVLGKTGTAERCNNNGCPDQAWFAALVPDAKRPIVVVATVENGGFGTTTAAPIVCKVLRKFYAQSPSQVPCKPVKSTSNEAE